MKQNINQDYVKNLISEIGITIQTAAHYFWQYQSYSEFIWDFQIIGVSIHFLQNSEFLFINWEKSLECLNNEIDEIHIAKREFYRKRQQKLKKKHSDFIKDYINSKDDILYTRREVKHNLELVYPEVKPISDTTVRRWMKRDLKMSFKKLERKNLNMFTPNKIRSFFESAAIQLKLEELRVEQIYIDEFSVNAHRSNLYGWSKRGEKGHLRLHSDNFTMSFVVAVSSLAVYGVVSMVVKSYWTKMEWRICKECCICFFL